jgi:SAM-dependent methyltransferase
MLARMTMEPRFFDWNRKWGAPFGLQGYALDPGRYDGTITEDARHEISRLGLFSAQPNNSTRRFEYPWAYFYADLHPPMRVLEIGGALSGFQFVLSREGHRVDNVDPGVEVFGFKITPGSVDALNLTFGTDVNVMICEIEKAALQANGYDRAFSLSVLEHLDSDVVAAVMRKVYEALKPGGLFILTVDLFLDLVPFTRREANQWGRNVPIPSLIDPARFEMVHGAREELYGFPEFDAQAILANAHQYFIGRNYPTLIQTLVLKRRA